MRISIPILAGLCLVLLPSVRPSALYANTAPSLNQPANMTVYENATADESATATDPDGNALTFFKTAGPTYMTVTTTTPGTGTATGNIHVAPGCGDVGTTGTVSVTDGSLSDSKTLTITVMPTCNPPNHPPVANAGGPYQPACPGVNTCFDGGGSTDPDPQKTLTYLWTFDDGSAPATGQNVCHSFLRCGNYNVCLTVTDTGSPPLNNTACTTQSIQISATQLNVSRKSSAVVNLKTGKPGDLEVITATYASSCSLAGDGISSWKMKYGASEKSPDSQSTSGNVTTLSFLNTTLSLLFGSLPSGKTPNVMVTIEGTTTNSQCMVDGTLTFDVQK